MMNRLFILFFINSLIINAQTVLEEMNHTADSISAYDSSFFKAYAFYKEKAYDSCYIYSSKALLKSNSKEKKDILNYIQGISAIKKELFKKALNNITVISEGRYKSLKQSNLGCVYLELKAYDKAIYHYKIWEQINSDTKLSLKRNGYHNLGLCYIHTKDFKSAKKYFDKELTLINVTDTLSIIKVKMDLATLYYDQYLDKEAIPLFKEAYGLASFFSDIEMKQQVSENMAIVEKNRKRYKESANYYKETLNWKDSINNRDRIWELTEKDKKVALAYKQSEIAVQDEKLKRQKVQRDGLIIGSVSLLLFIGGLGFFYKKLQSQNRFITKQKEALNAANKTKDYLFSVVSHDLRSPINTIKAQHKELNEHILNNNIEAIKATNNKVIAVTESTSHLLNNVLHWSLEQSDQLMFSLQEIALKPIVEHVVFDYKMVVAANNIGLNTVLENALVQVDKESLKIVLRNVLDNAVKYGGENIEITTGIASNEYAFIAVKDNGVGMSKEKLDKINSLTNLSVDKIDRAKGIGLGVVLCHTLVKKNQGVLTFSSEPNKGTTVRIELKNVPV